jgi:hypothetical protein
MDGGEIWGREPWDSCKMRAATGTEGSLQKNLQTDVECDVAYVYNWRGLAYMYKGKPDR